MKRFLLAASLLVGLTSCEDTAPLTLEQAALANELRTAPPRSVLIPARRNAGGVKFLVVCESQNGRIRTATFGHITFPCHSVSAEYTTDLAEQIIRSSQIVDVVTPSEPEYNGLVERLVMDFAGIGRQ